jgi:hypothetical protein
VEALRGNAPVLLQLWLATRMDVCAKLLFRHNQNATEFIDLSGETHRLRLQHVHRVTLMSLLRKLDDTLIERGKFVKQADKLFLNRPSPVQSLPI